MVRVRFAKIVAVMVMSIVGCADDDGGESGASTATVTSSSGTTEMSGTSGSGTSAATESTTAPIDDPEMFCAQFTEASECGYSDPVQQVYCEWVEVTPIAFDAGACVPGEPVGACYAKSGEVTDPGCAPPPGCDGDPYSIDLDGQTGVYLRCGNAGPISGAPCTYVEPGVFDPPECGCLCDLQTGSSTGAGTGSSSSGML